MAATKKRETMTMAEAAHRILLKHGAPMHYRKIIEKAIKAKMVVTHGKTPEQSLRSLMATEFTKKGTKSRFRPKGNGLYALTAHGKKTPPASFRRTTARKVQRPATKKKRRR